MSKKIDKTNRASEHFFIDVYERTIHVGVCNNTDELERWYTELSGDDDDNHDTYEALNFYDQHDDQWILLVKKHFSLNVCAHECFHLTHHLMSDIGHKFKVKSHEPHAWLHGFVTEAVYKLGTTLKTKVK